MVIQSEGQSAKAAGLELLGRLNSRWGVQLEHIIHNEALTVEQRRKLLTARMLEYTLAEIDAQTAGMGLEPQMLTAESKALIERVVAGDAPEIEPDFVMTMHNFEVIREYTGTQVNDYVVSLSKRFEAMSNAKTPADLALQIFGSGLVAVGTAMGGLAVDALRAGDSLLTAIRAGVTGVGVKTAITVVVIILAVILVYLLLENPKKIIGLVFNDTDDDLVVKDWRKGVNGGSDSDLWMEHGHMQNFPEDHATGNLDSPLVQVRKRVWLGPGDEDNSVYAGFFFADRNIGLRGSEGAMLFSSSTSSLKYMLMFAVPYVNDNGTDVRGFDGVAPTPQSIYRDLYNNRATRVDTTQFGVRMVSTVNDPSGGVVSLIASFSKT